MTTVEKTADVKPPRSAPSFFNFEESLEDWLCYLLVIFRLMASPMTKKRCSSCPWLKLAPTNSAARASIPTVFETRRSCLRLSSTPCMNISTPSRTC
ncbi:hypothetical protein L596_022198 [Steinernema carpocapsae]|uniref:Uncharacterized protein n=1 Tax=Steinernema carpocapsae TaxID=34508 RepID=A0A4U5ML21_STECR|nr:hypothetical protein L596_022198 [Steinernema carpocapsae]